MHEKTNQLVRVVALSVFVISTSHDDVSAQGQDAPRNAVSTGELLIEPPTLINLGFEWFIQGDDNRNAAVEVSYREQGETGWSSALPLLRLQGERVFSGTVFDVIAPNMFAGSILDLEPDTEYQARFVMSDPDGVIGEASKTVTVRTRAEPVPSEEGRLFHVYPHGFEGAKLEPAFEGLMCAYNYSCGPGDQATAARPRARPGDTFLVHAGLYGYNRYEYGRQGGTFPYEGTYRLTADGTPARPIAIKAAGDGEVIFDGDGNFALFSVVAADYTYFEGVTFRNAEFAIWAGDQFIAGAKGLSVKHSRFEDVGVGVFTNYSGSSNFYIADNWFYGRNNPEHLIGWSDAQIWGRFDGVDGQVHPPVMASYLAVKLYGPGHVVAYNYIADFHDGIDVETYGNPDGSVASGPGMPDGPKYPPREYLGLETGVPSRSTSTTTTSPTPTTTRSRPTGVCTTYACSGTCSSTTRRTRSTISRSSEDPSTGFGTSPTTSLAARAASWGPPGSCSTTTPSCLRRPGGRITHIGGTI